jgi:transporter family-2 protein
MKVPGFLPPLVAIAAGALSALQSRLNGELSAALGNSLQAAFTNFFIGFIIVIVLTISMKSIRSGLKRIPGALRDGSLKWWHLLIGLLGGLFVAVQSQTVPLVGVAVFTVAMVAGQSTNSLIVDRVGLGPAGKQAITRRRVASAVLAVLAVTVAVWNRAGSADFSTIAIIVIFSAGAVLAVQQAFAGRVARSTGSPLSATFINFAGGTTALGAAFGLAWAFTESDGAAPPTGPWWLYAGGVIGFVFIAVTSWTVPILGVLVFALLAIAGQLSGALALDLFAPTKGTVVGWNLVAGVILAFVAVCISGVGRSGKR